MGAYIVRRLLLMIPTLLLATLIIFATARLIPGSVIDLILSQQEWATKLDHEKLQHELGLDSPMLVQYGKWIGNIVLHGDMGKSMWTGEPVLSEILHRFPVSLELGFLALIVSQIIALPIGVFSAIRQDTMGDYVARSISIAFIALPGFWLGTMVMVFPSIWWGWAPSMEYVSIWDAPIPNLLMVTPPAIILGMVLSGTTMRMTRTMMLEVMRQDYVRTAWSKGLTERVVILRHALKNALIPVVTVVGLQLPLLVGGSIILENIFVLPGIGRLLIETINKRDYTMLSGINLFVAVFVLMINLLVDLSYGFLDPRVKHS